MRELLCTDMFMMPATDVLGHYIGGRRYGSGAISRNGGTVRGRVRQKSHKQAVLLQLGTLRSTLNLAAVAHCNSPLRHRRAAHSKSQLLSCTHIGCVPLQPGPHGSDLHNMNC